MLLTSEERIRRIRLLRPKLGASQLALVVKNLPANARDYKRCRFSPWIGKIPWKQAQQITPVYLPENPMDYSPQVVETDVTEVTWHAHKLGKESLWHMTFTS